MTDPILKTKAEGMIEAATILLESLEQLPSAQCLPGYDDLRASLVMLGVMEELSEAPEKDLVAIEVANEIGPIFWIGLFLIPNEEGEIIESMIPLQSPKNGVMLTYTMDLLSLPDLLILCDTIQKNTSYEYRIVEYRGENVVDKTFFSRTNSKTIH